MRHQHFLLALVLRVALDQGVRGRFRVLDHVGEGLGIGRHEPLDEVRALGNVLVRCEDARAVALDAQVLAMEDRQGTRSPGLVLKLGNLGVDVARNHVHAVQQQQVFVGRRNGRLLDVRQRQAVLGQRGFRKM